MDEQNSNATIGLSLPLSELPPKVGQLVARYPHKLLLGQFPGLNRTWRHFHDATGKVVLSYRAVSPRTLHVPGGWARPWTIHSVVAWRAPVGRLLRVYEHTCGGTIHHLVESRVPTYNRLSSRCAESRLVVDNPSPCCLAALPECAFRSPRAPLARQIKALSESAIDARKGKTE